jgi:ATP-dependent DNA helicase DinG
LQIVTLAGEIYELFRDGGSLEAALEGFSHRPEQLHMAEAVSEAMTLGHDLIIEAGTGTGKTLAYLVPVLISARRAVISTGTKTLQDQLFHRDLPNLGRALGRPATVALLKGRGNYLCLHRLDIAQHDLLSSTPADNSAFALVVNWSRRTSTGDIGEVDGIGEGDPVWSRVTSTVDNCLGTECRFIDKCHVAKARQAAMRATIVIVNHHLLMADLSLKDDGFGELLPGFETVIVDEAHQFPDTAQSFFNSTVTSRQIRELVGDMRAEISLAGHDDDALTKLARECEANLRSAVGVLAGSPRNLAWDAISPDAASALSDLSAVMNHLAGQFANREDDMTPGLRRCAERVRNVVHAFKVLEDAEDNPGLRWIEVARGNFSAHFSPVDVAESLARVLQSQSCNWVMTSATLAVNGDFTHFINRLGIRDAECVVIESPFDYPSQAMIYVPDDLPSPSAPGYTEAAVDAVLPILRYTGGRAFFLFTSHRALRIASDRLSGLDEFELLVQGQQPRSRLLDLFVRLDRAVLLGTASFWEGVDIRGAALVVVAIDKLPFAAPDDPMLQVRLERIREAGGNPFGDYQLPQAVLSLKQGVGRLIRDYDDYGVIVLCDPRLYSRGYGRVFLRSLPDAPVVRQSGDVYDFLAMKEGPQE